MPSRMMDARTFLPATFSSDESNALDGVDTADDVLGPSRSFFPITASKECRKDYICSADAAVVSFLCAMRYPVTTILFPARILSISSLPVSTNSRGSSASLWGVDTIIRFSSPTRRRTAELICWLPRPSMKPWAPIGLTMTLTLFSLSNKAKRSSSDVGTDRADNDLNALFSIQ